MPTNLYGPGDNFNLQNSDVLPAPQNSNCPGCEFSLNLGCRLCVKLWQTFVNFTIDAYIA
jgi:hypothetical protein